MDIRSFLLCLLLSSFIFVSKTQHTLVAVGFQIGSQRSFQRFELESGTLIGDSCVFPTQFIASMTFLQNGNLAVSLEGEGAIREGMIQTFGPEGCVPIETCEEMDTARTNTNMNVDPVTRTLYGTLGNSVTVNSFTSPCEPTPVCSDITTGPPSVATTIVIGMTVYMADPFDNEIVKMSLPASPPAMCSMIGEPIISPCTEIKGFAVFDSTRILVVCGEDEMGDSHLYNINDDSFIETGFPQIPNSDRIVGLAVGGAICQTSQIDSAQRIALLSGSSGYRK